MAEVFIREGETQQQVARELLDQAGHPDHVVWQPRANTPGGGVYYIPDEEVEGIVSRREAARAASQQLVDDRIAAMNERDELASKTGLTPDELGFPANSGGDLASLGQPGGEPNPIDPARSEDQRRYEEVARVDGVAEAQDAQVQRAQERAAADDDAQDAQTDADIKAEDEAAEARAEEKAADDNRAAARKAARKAAASKADTSDNKE